MILAETLVSDRKHPSFLERVFAVACYAKEGSPGSLGLRSAFGTADQAPKHNDESGRLGDVQSPASPTTRCTYG